MLQIYNISVFAEVRLGLWSVWDSSSLLCLLPCLVGEVILSLSMNPVVSLPFLQATGPYLSLWKPSLCEEFNERELAAELDFCESWWGLIFCSIFEPDMNLGLGLLLFGLELLDIVIGPGEKEDVDILLIRYVGSKAALILCRRTSWKSSSFFLWNTAEI